MASHQHTVGGKWSRTYTAWANMRKRCRPGHPRHDRYAGRGITVCKRWEVFDNFLADMGECPPGMTLDRTHNDRGYSKRNCRWATPLQQARNRDYITFKGVSLPMREWERRLGFTRPGTITRRLKLGWSLKRALSEPRNKTGRR